jgi:hypothetical protein
MHICAIRTGGSSYAVALVCRSVAAVVAVRLGGLATLGEVLGAQAAHDCACRP